MAVLRRCPFPGNVRELENLMERCVALNSGGTIGVDLFPDELLSHPSPGPVAGRALDIPEAGFDLEAYLAALKGHFMYRALERAEGNKTKAARLLGMSFRAYRYWLQEMGGPGTLPPGFPRPETFPPADGGETDAKGEIPNEFL